MRLVISVLICCLFAGGAMAEKAVHETQRDVPIPCNLALITYDWDFAVGDQGFTTGNCDAGGSPAWEFGTTGYVSGAPGTVWGTLLEADYPTDTGDALTSPLFLVDETATLMEVHHYYDAEALWDGGNVTVNGVTIAPMAGYPGIISTPGDWYAWCVDLEEGFTGLDSGWITSCFDLSAFLGEDIRVSFEFGSDDSFVEAGWYIASVRLGSDVTPVENGSWSGVKSLYR